MKKMEFLTGLKGIACLVVSVNHCLGAFCNFGLYKEKPYCFLYNGSLMVSLFIILSNFFLIYSVLEREDGGCLRLKELGWKVAKRYFRLAIPLFFVFIIICLMQNLGLFHWYEILSITESQRKEADYLNYIVKYTPKEAIFTALSCLFSSTTKFTFVIWMLPALFKSYMLTVLTAVAVYGMKRKYQVGIFVLDGLIYFKFFGGYYVCSVIAGLVALIYIYSKKTKICYEFWKFQ